MSKRFLSLLMVLMLCFSLLPTAAIAENAKTDPAAVQEQQEPGTSATVQEQQKFEASPSVQSLALCNTKRLTMRLQQDGQFLSYKKTLNSTDNSIRNVKAVKCTVHTDNDGDGRCDYCNGKFAARINTTVYTDLQDAIDAYVFNDTIYLLDDVTGTYTINNGQRRINLNGHTLQSLLVTGSGSLAPQGLDGTIQNLTFNGTEAKFVSNAYPVFGQVTISGGATWSSILPDAGDYEKHGNRYGYKVYADPANKNSYTWYDRNTIKDYAGSNNYISNVSILSLPITGKYTLMLGSEPLADRRVAEPDEELEFSVTNVNTEAPDIVECIVYYKKVGDSTAGQIQMSYDSGSKRYKSDSAFSFGKFGEYDVWAELTMYGYKCTTGKYRVKSKKDLTNAKIRLKNDEFTYTPKPGGGAEEFTAEIDSVTLYAGTAKEETVPASAYNVVSGDKGTNAGGYTLKIEAKENSNYTGSATAEWNIIPCELTYVIKCSSKVYDGKKDAQIESIEFFNGDDKVALTEGDDYTVSVKYDSEDVGANLGDNPVNVNATITLNNDAKNNYSITGGRASGHITPAPIDNIAGYSDYTYKICYNNTFKRLITATSFGAPDRNNYVVVSDLVGYGDTGIFNNGIESENGGLSFALKSGLTFNDVNKSCKVKVRIFTKDYNYCSDYLYFTVEVADREKLKLHVEAITMDYNGEDVPNESIKGTAKIGESIISDGTWSFTEINRSRKNVKDSGMFKVEFVPNGELQKYYYTANTDVSVTINARDIGDEGVTFTYGDSHTYTGTAVKPAVTVKYGGKTLTEGEDYTLAYPADATNAGEKKITVNGLGNFKGTKELDYTIAPCSTTPTIEWSEPDKVYTYDETAKTPGVTVKVNGVTLKKDVDYEVAYSNNVNAEDGAKVTVTSKGNYSFAKRELYFRIEKADSAINTKPAANNFTYDAKTHKLIIEGEAKGGTFEYKLEGGEWTKDIPMKKDAGEYTVWYRVAGDRNHKDIAENDENKVKVTIERKDIAEAKVVLGPSLTYNREEQEQTVFHVRFDNQINASFDVTDNRATDAGTYRLKVIGKNNFKGEQEVEFTIAKKEVTADVTVGGNYTYNGTEIKPTDITVKDGNAVIPDSEYSVGYADNKNAGDAKVIITNAENGNYIVSGVGVFKINKATVKVKPRDISKVYGDEPGFKLQSENHLITAGELETFANSAIFTSDGAAKTAPVTASGYVISARLTNSETSNLILEVDGTGILTVVKAPLIITVKAVSREYGAENPALEAKYSGFVNGDDESVLEGTLELTYDERINDTTPVGIHEGVAVASGLTAKNYAITYVPGNVTITKIPVSPSAGTARITYISVVFDKSLKGLTDANFVVSDGEGNPVDAASTTASPDGRTYTLSGSFEVGKEYTVNVVLSGAAVEATHQLTTDEILITPIRTSSGGDGSISETYTVSFDTNGGSELSKQTVARNTTVKEPTAPTKEGFDFAGWYTDRTLKMKYDFSAKITKSITLYAAWTEKNNSENQIILTIGEKNAKVFGSIKSNDVAPKIVNDRTMLPARFVAEHLGADVSWDGEKELVTIKGKNLKTNEDITILIYIGSDIAYVNGKEIKLDSAAFVENDRTYTPIRFISEELGASVEWFEKEQKVVIAK